MILISAAGVGAAILLLIAAIVTSNLLFVSIGIGVSVASALLLAMGALGEFTRTRGSSPAAAGAGTVGQAAMAPVSAGGGSAAAGAVRTPAPVPIPAGQASSNATGRNGRVAGAPYSEIVLVLPGRRRFHRPGCTGLAGRVTEELTLDEALEEGFSPCSICHPEAAPGSWEVEAPLAEFPTAWLVPAGDGAPGNAGAEVKAETAGDSGIGATTEGSPARTADDDSRTGMTAQDSFARAAAAEDSPSATAAGESRAGQTAEGSPARDEAAGDSRTGQPAEDSPSPSAAVAGESRVGQPAEGSPARDEAAGDSRTGELAGDPRTGETAEGSPGPAADEDSRTGAATGGQRSGGDGSSVAPDTTVHVVRGVSRHHLADCVLIHVVDNEDVDTMTLAEAEAAGCTPCRACHSD